MRKGEGSNAQAFPFRGRCPSAHTGADEVHPFKPSVPSTDHRNRAAQCAAPTGWSGFPTTGDRKGRPCGFMRVCLNPGAGGSRTRPYGVSRVPLLSWGPVPDRPADNGPAITCSAQPGAEVEPQQLQFLLPQAPVGRREFRPTTQISTRRKFYTSQQVRVPRTGVRGRLPLSRGDGRRPEGIGRANMSAKRSS